MFKSGRMRGALLVAIAAATLPILAACSAPAGGGSTPSSGSAKPVNIAFVSYTGGDIVESYVRGMESVVTPAGGSVTLFNANFDPQAQITQCQDAITSGRYNAIVITPVDPLTAQPCVAAANTAGIPVGTLETAVGTDPFSLTPQVPGVVAVVATPLATQTALDGEMLTAACAGKNPCNVIAEVASATDRFTNARVQAVKDQFAAQGIVVVQEIATGYDPGEVARQMPDALSAHPDTNVFLSVSDLSAVAAIPAITAAGLTEQVKILGLGGSAGGAEAVKSGTIFATTGNWPQQYGAFLATALTQAVNGETVNPVSLDMVKADTPALVTKDTVDQFTPEWGLQG